MKPVPLWKVKRELKRIVRQFTGLTRYLIEYFFLRRWYDIWGARRIVNHGGLQSIGDEVAIYLVYAPDGLLSSHHDTLDQLAADGISVVVVSNVPLLEKDREALYPKTALVIERPNVGYDFGGYRDAVLSLTPFFPQLERLYILNDSVWMIDAEKSWFQQVREIDSDFVGATSNYGIARVDAADFREITWDYTPGHRNFHYASYALAFGGNILRDPAFLRYWQKYRLSFSKKNTVKRGEIGLSAWVLSHGYTHDATCEVFELDQELASLDNTELDRIAKNIVIPEDVQLLQQHPIALQSDPETETGRHERVQIILTAVARQAMGYAMPYYNLNYRGFQFLKKSPLRLSRGGAETMLRIMSDLDSPIGRRAYAEAQAAFAARKDQAIKAVPQSAEAVP